MYEKMGFKRSVAFSRLPIIRQLFNGGYWVFAHWIRPNLPKKKKIMIVDQDFAPTKKFGHHTILRAVEKLSTG